MVCYEITLPYPQADCSESDHTHTRVATCEPNLEYN